MLDPHQQRACEAPERLVRALAGAGSGKTRLLMARYQWLRDRGVSPHRILLVTFNKGAAVEMQTRLGDTLADARTLHSLGYQVLREEWPGRGVANEHASRRLIRDALAAAPKTVKLADAVKAIRYCKATNTSIPDALAAALDRYEKLLTEAKLWDFEDLILKATMALTPLDIAERWQARYSDILVDELQDTSRLQWDLIVSLLAPTTRLFIVGDLSQSIYSFRGATPSTVLHYLTCALGKFAEYRLPLNYRSRPKIVYLANALIRGRAGAVELEPTQADEDVDVSWAAATDASTQAADAIERLSALNLPWQDCAILYRTNAQSEAIESLCIRLCIPYRIAGVNFYERSEILDCLAYLRLSQGWDADALDRVYNRPSRYLGRAWRDELRAQGDWPTLIAGKARFSRRYMAERARELVECIRDLQSFAKRADSPHTILRYAITRTGYREWLTGEEPSTEDEARADNLDALLDAATHWQSLEDAFAAQAASAKRRSADSPERPALTLSTIHRAKGLEWEAVVVLGVCDGILPLRATDEEERRIFYVAVTRAKRYLIVLRPDAGKTRSTFWAPTAADAAETL